MPMRIIAIRSLWRIELFARHWTVLQTIATIAIQANQGIELKLDIRGSIF
jgi:hypothetical protein